MKLNINMYISSNNAEAIVLLVEEAQKFLNQQAALLSATAVNDEEYNRTAMWKLANIELQDGLSQIKSQIADQL